LTDLAVLLGGLLLWPLLATGGVLFATALSPSLGGRAGRALPASIQLALGTLLCLFVSTRSERLQFDAGSLADGEIWGSRLLLGLDGVSAPGLLLTSGFALAWSLVQHEAQRVPDSPTIPLETDSIAGPLLVTMLVSGFFLSRDLLVLPTLLLALELPLVLWAQLRPSLPRLLASGAVLFGAIQMAELHARAFGSWSFSYDRLLRMTLPPAFQRPIFLWICGGLCAWALLLFLGLHRQVTARPDPDARGRARPLLLLLPSLTTYALLRFAVPLLPHAARSFRSEALTALSAALACLALIAIAFPGARPSASQSDGRMDVESSHLGSYVALLYSGCAAILLFGFRADSWRLALLISAFLPAAWALNAGLEAMGHSGRLGRTAFVVGPPAAAVAATYPDLSQTLPGALGLGVVLAASGAAAILGWNLYKSPAGAAGGTPSPRPRFGLLFVLLLGLAACGLGYRAGPALDALERYTKERITNPPRGGELRFERAGREISPTPAVGVDRPRERAGAPREP